MSPLKWNITSKYLHKYAKTMTISFFFNKHLADCILFVKKRVNLITNYSVSPMCSFPDKLKFL